MNANAANALTQTAKQVAISPGSYMWYLEYLPPTYSATGPNKSPVLIFLHGVGQNGDGSQGALQMLKDAAGSPPYMIDKNTWPTTFSFIVISPQTWGWWDSPKTVPLINQIGALYPGADITRVYLTGLSMGGAGVYDTMRQSKAVCDKLAAVIPICGAQGFGANDWIGPVTSGLPVWAFHNSNDPTVSVWNSRNWVNGLNAQNICPVAKYTEYVASSHDAWTKTYDYHSGGTTSTTGTPSTTAPSTTTTTTGTPSTTTPSTTTTTTGTPSTTTPSTTTTTTGTPSTTTPSTTTTTTGTPSTTAPSTTGTQTPTPTSTPAPGVFQRKWTTPASPFGFWEYRPSTTPTPGIGYPLIIHLHGADGEGTGSSTDLNKAVQTSLPKYIRTGEWPTTYPFLVLCPQNNGIWDAGVSNVINTLLDLYSPEVDPTRIYLVGQGRGALGVVQYLKSNATRIDRTAAIFNVRVYTDAHNATIDLMVNDHLPTWWLTNNDDPNSDPIMTKNWANFLNARGANPAARLTINPSGGADSYTPAFNPANADPNNVYNWLLSKTNVR
ncbi:hypothetical protein PPL_04534 [Heterostelium album PN500]|uniref:Uncharacterized protein n=1 Tax=Heterostelium pallidum (strain ATCC 26659 / Pp 5 / PN500) TaxID=670386 RepID=D3B7U6_HETP5|nr:hypothetical protein PPL_04534 [Heterostelium album PN500]EFA82839.1 hypothetical protein PPL_04534 [Heterostelium album PN500]|eukprot:XP_020434956.1 hypothetical protein PPL_04534 [Heterostelium album PN500]